MCNIAGYVGYKNAAPILLEMLKKQEYLDGGLSTGIATIHEGKLYTAKVLGNVQDLIDKTDALNFPGTTGIIHSRPDDNYLEFAHPFLSENKKTAVVCNGNACTDEHLREIRNSLVWYLQKRCNIKFESAVSLPHQSTYPKLPDGRYVAFAETIAKTIEQIRKDVGASYEEALADASSKLFADVVNVLISANSPDNIYVARITRPMNIMAADNECYISTSQFGFPEIENVKYVKSLPQMKSCVINKDGYIETDYTVSGGKVTEFTKEEYDNIKNAIKRNLSESWHCMDNMGGGIFVTDRSADKLRPNVKAVYDVLWELHKEGILKSELRDSTIPWLPGKTVKRLFFHID